MEGPPFGFVVFNGPERFLAGHIHIQTDTCTEPVRKATKRASVQKEVKLGLRLQKAPAQAPVCFTVSALCFTVSALCFTVSALCFTVSA
jgi:hypothetical protein